MPSKRVTSDPDKRTAALHEAELKYQKENVQSTIIVKDEEIRRTRVRSTVLRDDVASIRLQLTQQTERYDKLSRQHAETRNKLVAATRRADEQDKKLKLQTREIANLKTELQSLNGVSQDSTKILSEKLALSRELANLKPELEHLRSQLANHGDVLAEKLALERQVNTLEVELANEKRAAQRAIQRQESKDTQVEEELRQQVQDLEKKLAAEKRIAQRAKQDADKGQDLEERLQQQADDFEAQLRAQQVDAAKARRELERQLAELTSQNEFIDERFTELKARLKETRQELKTCRAELQEVKLSAASRAVKEAPAAKSKSKLGQVGQKRRAEEMAEELDILATPTHEQKRTKKPLKKRVEALAGEKSMFSITPFLTKTISFADGPVEFTAGGEKQFPAADDGEEEDEADDVMDDTFAGHHSTESAVADEASAEVTVEEADEEPRLAKEVQKPSKTAAKPQPKPRGRPKTKISKGEQTLENVMEEAEDGSHENRTTAAKPVQKKTANAASATTTAAAAATTAEKVGAAEVEPKKKKRKLLGGAPKTLFDDDEAEAAPAAKRQPGKVQLGKTIGKVPMGPAGSRAFAGKTFSPLKRDRRGVNASFLA